MKVKLEHTFFPLVVGEEGDLIVLRIYPCCVLCFPTASALRQAVRRFRVSVQNSRGVDCLLLTLHRLPSTLLQLENGEFQCTIDYRDLLPHAPDSPLSIEIWLEKPHRCPQEVSIMQALALPRGVDDIMRSFIGTSLGATEVLETARFGLQPVQSAA